MSAVPAEIPIFSRQSIQAMSLIAKEIAKVLQEAGYIRVVENQPAPAAKEPA